MKTIAFIGTGAMGSRMARRLIDAGYRLRVWNRTAARTRQLEEAGAYAAASPKDAAATAQVVFSMVRDDAASQRVWFDPDSGAVGGMAADALAVECSTLSLPCVHEMARAFSERGLAFIDAPLAGSRPQADAGQLIFFAGGQQRDLERVRALLDVMGGAVHHAGPNGCGATIKLMVNALFGAQLAQFGELIGFADRCGLDVNAAIEIVASTPVCSPAARLAAQGMLAGTFQAAFPIDLVSKDFSLIEESARDVGADMPIGQTTAEVYRRACAEGLGEDNITGVVQLYRQNDP